MHSYIAGSWLNVTTKCSKFQMVKLGDYFVVVCGSSRVCSLIERTYFNSGCKSIWCVATHHTLSVRC